MPQRSRRELLFRRVLAWSLGWLVAAALYLLLIDITDLPELIVGAGAAVIAATGFELARERGTAGELGTRLRQLAGAHRPVRKVPSDILFVSIAAVRQLTHPRRVVGEFRTAPFQGVEDGSLEHGRCALAEALGSFAPNTMIVGVDGDRQLILGHQLRRSGGPEAIDLLRLG